MALEDFTKQGYEEFTIGGDFEEVIDSDAPELLDLSKCDVKAWDKNNTVRTADVLYIATMALEDSPDGGTNNVLAIKCKAGTELLTPYIITFYGETTLGEKWEIDVKMKIKETGPTS